jgi:2,4-diketo-3-deoxy-L-fuconate hydrolase
MPVIWRATGNPYPPAHAGYRSPPPCSRTGKFICVGLNYADHAAESGMPVPAEPVLFTKTTSALIGCNDPVVLPQGSVKSDWEVELGVVIGATARYVSEADAIKHVAGYCVVNDVSEREYQLERGGSGTRARAATPSARSARGWSPPTKCPTRRTSTCGWK